MFVRLLTLLAAVLSLGSQAAAPSRWEWVQPQPHRQNWVDLAAGPAGFVGLTDGHGGRKIYHSPDGEQWQLAPAPSTAGLRRVVYVNGIYLALGDSSTILSSTDGLDWQIRYTDAGTGWLFDAAYGNGMYVAVGYNSVAYCSKDLKSWTRLPFSAGYSLLNVEFGNGFFLAVANIGKAYRSSDGRTWSAIEWPAAVGTGNWSTYEAGLAFNGGKFILSMSGGTASSADGLDWTSCSPTFFRKLCAVEDQFIGMAGNSLSISSNGSTWIPTASLSDWNTHFTGVARLNDHWLAVGDAGLIYRSSNGINWESLVDPVDFSQSKLAFANGVFLRYGDEPGVHVSSDGSNWTFNADAPDFITLIGGNSLWVGITGDGKAAVSTDTQQWTETVLPAQPYGPVLFGQSVFVVAAAGGVLISADGVTWQLVATPGAASVRLIGFENGIFSAFNENSAPMTSTDGRSWTLHAPVQVGSAGQFFAAGNGRFVGIGGGGMGPGSVMWSTNGMEWYSQRLESGSSYVYTSLKFGAGYFLMTDNRGGIHHSADGINWSGQPQAAHTLTDAAFGSGVWIVCGGNSILKSGEPLSAKSAATLQLTHSSFSTWNLIVTGSVGERWLIQSAATVDSPWSPVQSVQIPTGGSVSVALPDGPVSAFFRAVVQP